MRWRMCPLLQQDFPVPGVPRTAAGLPIHPLCAARAVQLLPGSLAVPPGQPAEPAEPQRCPWPGGEQGGECSPSPAGPGGESQGGQTARAGLTKGRRLRSVTAEGVCRAHRNLIQQHCSLFTCWVEME